MIKPKAPLKERAQDRQRATEEAIVDREARRLELRAKRERKRRRQRTGHG
jgi:hypothetical protein